MSIGGLKMIFQRVKKLREDYEYTQDFVASKLKINRVVYNRYENGIRDIPIDILIELSKLYNVSTCYILEQTNIKNYDIFLRDIQEFEDTLLCNQCGKKNMKHSCEQNYLFICSSCNFSMDMKSTNYCKN